MKAEKQHGVKYDLLKTPQIDYSFLEKMKEARVLIINATGQICYLPTDKTPIK